MQYPKKLSCRNEESQSQSVAQSVADLLRDDRAARLLHLVAERYASLPRGSQDAQDLVADTVVALIGREIAGDIDTVSATLQREVRRRAKAYRRAAECSALVPLDDAPADALVDDSSTDRQNEPIDLPRDAGGIVQRIREMAADDEPVLRLVELRVLGSARRRDARSAGMTPKVYRGASERLALYAKRASAAALSDAAAAPCARAIESHR